MSLVTLLALIQADTDVYSFSPELKADGDKDLGPNIDDCEGSAHRVSKTGSLEQLEADAYYFYNIARPGPLNIGRIDLIP